MLRARARKLFDSKTNFPDNARFRSEGFPSGQRDQTVNLTALPSKVRILPPPPNMIKRLRKTSGCSSMVELQPSKLIAWVRFPSPAPSLYTGSGIEQGATV